MYMLFVVYIYLATKLEPILAIICKYSRLKYLVLLVLQVEYDLRETYVPIHGRLQVFLT